jgi:hypothetical protein
MSVLISFNEFKSHKSSYALTRLAAGLVLEKLVYEPKLQSAADALTIRSRRITFLPWMPLIF